MQAPPKLWPLSDRRTKPTRSSIPTSFPAVFFKEATPHTTLTFAREAGGHACLNAGHVARPPPANLRALREIRCRCFTTFS